MRTYRLEIRVLQIAVLLTMIVMVFGMVNVWRGVSEIPPIDDIVQDGTPPGVDDEEPIDETPVNTKIVCLGDSFTYGWPGDPKDAWPQRVADVLEIEVINAGKISQNASDLVQRFDQDVLANEPGRVIIFAGVGDAIREIPLEEYQANIIDMVNKAEADHIEPILALPISFPGTAALNQAYREWEISYAQEKNIKMLDFQQVLFDTEGKILSKYSNDGKYPNKEGHKAMGDYVAGVFK